MRCQGDAYASLATYRHYDVVSESTYYRLGFPIPVPIQHPALMLWLFVATIVAVVVGVFWMILWLLSIAVVTLISSLRRLSTIIARAFLSQHPLLWMLQASPFILPYSKAQIHRKITRP